MYTVIITGGLGSGKSALSDALCALGAKRLDTDTVSHDLLECDEELRAELAARFGTEILDENGAVAPRRLASAAFADGASTRALNAITFPRIIAETGRRLADAHAVAASDDVFLIEIPLLVEAPEFAALADEVIAVEAPAELRLARAVERGMDEADARARMELQASDEERRALADTVCPNDGTVEDLRVWAQTWWSERTRS